jgi:hypothetical protein
MVSITAKGFWPGIEFGESLHFKSLRVVPLIGPSNNDPSYRLFGPDVAGDVQVEEVDDAGSVPNLRVTNRLKDRVLLIDGQELIGAKQNRIMNTDVLVPASEKIMIPVSCVEAGRWSYARGGFAAGKMAYSSARAAKSSQVYESLRATSEHRSDQRAVWSGVEKLMGRLSATSSTNAMADVYRQREQDLAEAREAFTLPENTVGIVVYSGERLLGLDLFDRTATLVHHWTSLLDSYVLNWLAFEKGDTNDAGVEPSEYATTLEELFESLQRAEWERFDAPGEGDDLRWESDRLTASALAWGEGDTQSIVHLQAFPRETREVREASSVTFGTPVSTVEKRAGESAGRRCSHCGFLYGLVVTPDGDYCNHCGHA